MRSARRLLFGGLAAASLLAALPASTLAADGTPTIDSGDTAWLLIATALVMVMLPGLALFYGGLVRRKNVLSTIMHSFFGLALVSASSGSSSASRSRSAPTSGGLGLIGNPLEYVGFITVGLTPNPTYGPTIPFILFAAFQLMFAAITPALITGAFAERKRFGAFVLFTILWSILVYSPVAHWVWATDGWLFKLGALDFAGGTVVHATSGVSALLVAIMIGRRVLNGEGIEPHDIPMTVLGAGLLWFGWFGFNAGSALGANGLAANALLVTNTAAAAATITWVLASYVHKKKVSVVGAAAGAVAGLVAITPASGFVTAGGALAIGLVAGGLCYSATLLRERIHVDDALDVFAVHGVGRHVRRHRDGRVRHDRDQRRGERPDRRQPRPGRDPGRRGPGHDHLRGRRNVRHRQAGGRPPRDARRGSRGGDGPRPGGPRRGRLPGLTASAPAGRAEPLAWRGPRTALADPPPRAAVRATPGGWLQPATQPQPARRRAVSSPGGGRARCLFREGNPSGRRRHATRYSRIRSRSVHPSGARRPAPGSRARQLSTGRTTDMTFPAFNTDAAPRPRRPRADP